MNKTTLKLNKKQQELLNQILSKVGDLNFKRRIIAMLSYLDIKDGDCASIAYLDMTFGKMTAEAKKKTREDLLKYCERDTEAMVWIVEELGKIRNHAKK